jgi:hypothetical protein
VNSLAYILPPPTPTNTPTATATNTPTPTVTPTPRQFTNLDLRLNGVHYNLRAPMFWAIFNETSEDIYDSGTTFDSDLIQTRFSSFLLQQPYCSIGSIPGNNAAESYLLDGTSYIQHCPYDHRYMAAQTILNGMLNIERRSFDGNTTFGVNRAFEYFAIFSSSVWEENYDLWEFSQCSSDSNSYARARLASDTTNWTPAIDWLDQYLQCLVALPNPSEQTIQRIQRAYNRTIWNAIDDAINDFYAYPDRDPSNGAYQLKDVNINSRSLIACVGGCYRRDVNALGTPMPTYYEVYQEDGQAFLSFNIQASQITQQLINDAYQAHIQQINTYIPSFPSVLQPVLVYSYASDGQLLGYRWVTKVYQQVQNADHVPRRLGE